MTKYKVSELEGALLDAAVAVCYGYTPTDPHKILWIVPGQMGITGDSKEFKPSTDWHFGGAIIQEDQIFLSPPSTEHHHGGTTPGWNNYTFWRATVSANTRTFTKPGDEDSPLATRGRVGRGAGPTALIAAMRAVVASYGYEEIELP